MPPKISKAKSEAWTLVQHSGAGYGGKPEWARGVEVRSLNGHDDMTRSAEIKLVKEEGGFIFYSYHEASDAEDKINLSGSGMYPRCTGEFSTKMIDGLRIYVPLKDVS